MTNEANVPVRAQVLREAEALITGDRNNQYGPPTQDFSRSADALSALGYRHGDRGLQAHDIAVIIAVVKMSRITWSPEKRDSWVDIAGYAGCGYECVIEEKSRDKNGTTEGNTRPDASSDDKPAIRHTVYGVPFDCEADARRAANLIQAEWRARRPAR